MVQSDLNWPLTHEMQLAVHVHAEPTAVPFVVFRLVHETGVYAMQLVPSADS